MKSDETRKQIENMKETLKTQEYRESVDNVANKTAYAIRKIYEELAGYGFSDEEAYELTKIWCVKNLNH